MRNYLFCLALWGAVACSDKNEVVQPPVNPAMFYTHLQNKEVKPGNGHGIDIDRDGSIDFIFFVIHIGDPLFQQDKFRFLAGSTIQRNLFVDDRNYSPVLSKNSIIPPGNSPPYEWFEVSEVFLAEKIMTINAPAFWQGPWKDVSNKYLAVQILKNNQRFNGWIELSFDMANEKLILHKAAISTEAEKEVKAGV